MSDWILKTGLFEVVCVIFILHACRHWQDNALSTNVLALFRLLISLGNLFLPGGYQGSRCISSIQKTKQKTKKERKGGTTKE